MPDELVQQTAIYGIEPLEFNVLQLDFPSISPFLGDTWWLETMDYVNDKGDSVPPNQIGSSGISVGVPNPEPYVRYDSSGNPIVGEVVIVRSTRDGSFPLPQYPPGKTGFVLKVINLTDRQIQASFPQVFTYYGNAVYGQAQRMGGMISPGEAGIYRVAIAEQGKLNWTWEGIANRTIS
jgi:hypothetical protein